MKSGKLRHRIKVLQDIETGKNAYGIPQRQTRLVGYGYASVESLSGLELYNARQVAPEVTHRVEMRFFPGLSSDMKLVMAAGKELQILSPPLDKDERGIELEFLAKEKP